MTKPTPQRVINFIGLKSLEIALVLGAVSLFHFIGNFLMGDYSSCSYPLITSTKEYMASIMCPVMEYVCMVLIGGLFLLTMGILVLAMGILVYGIFVAIRAICRKNWEWAGEIMKRKKK
jgi:hypothetical protein